METREHFRFNQDGGNYPDGSVVEVTTADGNTMRYQVGNTGMRLDAGGASSGGSSEGVTAGDFAGLNSVGLNIQRPGGSNSAFDTSSENYLFKSPLSTLETIRNVSNIIVGASKSFDTLTTLQTSAEVIIDCEL